MSGSGLRVKGSFFAGSDDRHSRAGLRVHGSWLSPFRRRPVVFGRNDAARCSFRSKPQTEWLLHPLSGDTSGLRGTG